MKVKLSTQKLYSWIIVYMLSFLAFLNLGNEILNLIGMQIIWDTVILYGVLIASVFCGVVLCIREHNRINVDVICIFLFFVMSYATSYLLYPKNAEYLFTSWMDYSTNPIYVILLYSLPGYVFMRKIRQYNYLEHYMKNFSYIVVIMSIVVFFLSRESSAAQYMTFSYNMLTHLFYLIICPPDKGKILHYSIVMIGGFVFLFGGARGAALSLLVAWIIYYIFLHKLTSKSFFSIVVASIGIISFSVLKKQILSVIVGILEKSSINSRTVYLLLNGEMLSDSPRMKLYRVAINNTGIVGKGFMGDRVILRNYPHNLFLEVLFQFGWIIGLLICTILFVVIIAGLYRANKTEFLLICLLLPCGFLKLMLTGSYLNQEPALYILIGLCINSIIRGNKNANIND